MRAGSRNEVTLSTDHSVLLIVERHTLNNTSEAFKIFIGRCGRILHRVSRSPVAYTIFQLIHCSQINRDLFPI